jgi:flavin reductase (DIM6/NTAB) family NADH-FMN oxidoreductase RutF
MNYIDTQELNHYSIRAKDGDIGHITDFYFDEKLFYLRYLVIDTGKFLSRNLVLLSPMSFYKVDLENKVIEILMTKKELENSPSFESVEIVSRQYEREYNDYFNWPYYWGMESAAWAIGPYAVRGMDYPFFGKISHSVSKKGDPLDDGKNCGLRSSKEICSYSVEGIDEKFGHIQGFIVNPKSLSIDFIIIDTINYLPSKNIILRPEWLEDISWDAESVKFPFTKELIKSAPAYKKGTLSEKIINDSDKHFQSALNDHYRHKSNVAKIKSIENNIFGMSEERDEANQISEKEAVVGHIPSGLFIVTVKNQNTEKYEGFLASWVQQASFEPLLISLCIRDGRPGVENILNKEPFCINVVGKDSTEYLSYFMKENHDGMNPLDKVPHEIVHGKGMFIDAARSVVVCEAREISHPGDHYLITAEVMDGLILNNSESSKAYFRDNGNHY